MTEITQNDLIKLIEEKQENAKNMFYEARYSEKDFDKAERTRVRCLAEMDTYQDLICYIKSVKIVPERNDEEVIAKSIDDLKKMLDNAPIMPYREPTVEPLRNDRFREFEFIYDKNIITSIVDAKEVVFFEFKQEDGDYRVAMWGKGGLYRDKLFTEESNAKACYNDLVEWWKYWKQI